MGYGSYNSSDWSKLRKSKNMDNTKSENEIFTRRSIDPRFDPKFIAKREARDSEDHPNSTPIILGLDVTGSMGYLSNQIARTSLNETMLKLYSTNAIEDPSLLFAAYGDCNDEGVLQVTQFESDIRIAEQLMELWLENGGNGKVTPTLLWHFAGTRTSLDADEKHGKKGFLITIGDDAECRNDEYSDAAFKRIFPGETVKSAKAMLEEAQKKFEVLHIALSNSGTSIPDTFEKLVPGHVIAMDKQDVEFLPEVIISSMQIVNGVDKAQSINQWSELARPVVANALKNLTAGNSKTGFVF